ncbi:hypothetical protein JX265_004853 [Neoarthrinium moseri]|uniref:Acetyl-CoA synthetase-like protein n=1 Tax=Neoarthrinium moseri TaxID=1658444 RepID=A0A9Q0AR96_9PEZI|nr:hypothetical protein JX266_007104 [Neoarthrinium moseri]KAI1874645.1 hypothetical protein JX265_004853 [Neoarthrinium moseri]
MATQTTTQEGAAIVVGPRTPVLWSKTLGTLIREQAAKHGDKDAIVVPWQSTRMSYRQVEDRSKLVATSLISMGLQHGDAIGVMAGNRVEYVEVFMGAGRIGCPAVVLNNTYSAEELRQALARANCKMLFIATRIGTRSLRGHIAKALGACWPQTDLRHVVCFGDAPNVAEVSIQTYASFLQGLPRPIIEEARLESIEASVLNSDILNLQFTSGTTGMPKAACLTHHNIINNARFVGSAMKLTSDDVVCCPPPLFHCFGLVMGLLASFCYGSSIMFPSDNFSAESTIQAVVQHKATALLGVPTMFISELAVVKEKGYELTTIRTGLAAGAMVPSKLMKDIREQMNIEGMLIAYGMTETSPVTFITSIDDSQEKRFTTIGRVFPHTSAKVVNSRGDALPFGQRGEICTSGFALQKGYWKDEERTKQVMRPDENGVIWMHTGDEGFIGSDGYGRITGRIKDLIIRGGENISPSEIEDRLLEHTSIGESCVVGLEDHKYGEVVACFLSQARGASERPSDANVRSWVSQKLGRVKEPHYIFWVGDPGTGNEIPKTGSGKYQKHLVRRLGNRLVKARRSCSNPKL